MVKRTFYTPSNHIICILIHKFEDYYDDAKADFMERVITGYKTEMENFPHKIIDGMQSKEQVFEDTVKAIKEIL